MTDVTGGMTPAVAHNGIHGHSNGIYTYMGGTVHLDILQPHAIYIVINNRNCLSINPLLKEGHGLMDGHTNTGDLAGQPMNV